jgi:two-component system sensor kinase FixL
MTSSSPDHRASQILAAVFKSAVDAIVVIDARGRIEAFNPAAERLFGYQTSEVSGRNVTMLMPSPYHEEHDGYLSSYLATGHAKIIGIGREVTGLRKDGTMFPLHLSVGEMSIDGETKFTGILHDLSVRVAMEEQLREQAALARVGEMAAVIAHEVQNPLAGIRAAVEVIGSRLPQESGDTRVVREIVGRIDTLSGLIRDLLRFARPPQPKPVPVHLASLVAATAELLSGDPALSAVTLEVEGAAPPALADPELLKIVFQNLFVNAVHATGGRGRIRVAIQSSGESCRLHFIDDGAGIPAEIRERIFTPFFTTKARGTGLGLPTAKRLVEAQRGAISVECPPGGGTIVTVELPLADVSGASGGPVLESL